VKVVVKRELFWPGARVSCLLLGDDGLLGILGIISMCKCVIVCVCVCVYVFSHGNPWQ